MMKNIITIIIGLAIVILGLVWLRGQQAPAEVRNFDFSEYQQMAANSESTLMDGTYTVVPTATTLSWTGRAPLKSHYGTVDIEGGNLTIAGVGITGSVNLDMTTIVSEAGEGLDGHLKDADFFNVAKYPTATLAINDYQNGSLIGDLTIKGITQPVQLPVSLAVQGDTMVLKGEFNLDRTLWGIEYKSGSIFSDLGDAAINDDMEFVIELQAQKNG